MLHTGLIAQVPSPTAVRVLGPVSGGPVRHGSGGLVPPPIAVADAADDDRRPVVARGLKLKSKAAKNRRGDDDDSAANAAPAKSAATSTNLGPNDTNGSLAVGTSATSAFASFFKFGSDVDRVAPVLAALDAPAEPLYVTPLRHERAPQTIATVFGPFLLDPKHKFLIQVCMCAVSMCVSFI